jgi:hypothetical protein
VFYRLTAIEDCCFRFGSESNQFFGFHIQRLDKGDEFRLVTHKLDISLVQLLERGLQSSHQLYDSSKGSRHDLPPEPLIAASQHPASHYPCTRLVP